MKPGPPPTPDELLRLSGSWRYGARQKERAAGSNGGPAPAPEPTRPRVRCPSAPRFMRGEAKGAWRQIVPVLQQFGLFTDLDVLAVVRYCELWAEWRRALDWLKEHGSTYRVEPNKPGSGAVVDEEGIAENDEIIWIVKSYPQVKELRELSGQLLKIEREFGMTPSARTAIRMNQ